MFSFGFNKFSFGFKRPMIDFESLEFLFFVETFPNNVLNIFEEGVVRS